MLDAHRFPYKIRVDRRLKHQPCSEYFSFLNKRVSHLMSQDKFPPPAIMFGKNCVRLVGISRNKRPVGLPLSIHLFIFNTREYSFLFYIYPCLEPKCHTCSSSAQSQRKRSAVEIDCRRKNDGVSQEKISRWTNLHSYTSKDEPFYTI